MTDVKTKHLTIGNQIGELAGLAEEIGKIARKWKIPKSEAMNINLAVEEAVSNIILYAYTDQKQHEIRISLSLEKNMLTIIIADDGIPFNPLEREEPDISLPVDDRPVGGLGIFLIMNIMNEVFYLRKDNLNILTLHKTI
jgi:anti-sigma regulatory factor (Ser/Thr protein kinase)